jgi:selenide,water dikinase
MKTHHQHHYKRFILSSLKHKRRSYNRQPWQEPVSVNDKNDQERANGTSARKYDGGKYDGGKYDRQVTTRKLWCLCSELVAEGECTLENIRLTETVKKGGCAAKLPADELRGVLQSLQLHRAQELLVDASTMDDAGIWDLGDGRALVQTLDFFTPIVDDPYSFGMIAAANAISDVYAMGGTPKTAMTILAFPASTLPMDLLKPLMQGAIDKIHEAGACLVGGHSIDDETLKLGFSVTGMVNTQKIWSNASLKQGDRLILTKPLGTGTITSGIKLGKCTPASMSDAITSMTTLNRVPEILGDFDISAATDITGFGLAGHVLQMARASGVSVNIEVNALPALEGAMDLLRAEILNRAHRTNLKYVQDEVDFGSITPAERWLTVDPQTSGGILLAVPEQQADRALATIRTKFPRSAIIGNVGPIKDKKLLIH